VSRLAVPTVTHTKVLQNGGPGVLLQGGGGVFFQSEVCGNRGGGVRGAASGLRLGYCRVHGNEGFELNLAGLDADWPAVNLNYWGDAGGVEAGVSVPVAQTELSVLERPDPEAAVAVVPLLALQAPEGLSKGLWIRRSSRFAAVDARPRFDRPPFVAGVDALEAGDASTAAKALEEAARLDPSDPEAHYWFGLARLRLGDPARAAEAIERACVLSLRNVEYRRALAEAHLAAGNAREAELAYGDLLKLDPEDEAAKDALQRLRGPRPAPPPNRKPE